MGFFYLSGGLANEHATTLPMNLSLGNTAAHKKGIFLRFCNVSVNELLVWWFSDTCGFISNGIERESPTYIFYLLQNGHAIYIYTYIHTCGALADSVSFSVNHFLKILVQSVSHMQKFQMC